MVQRRFGPTRGAGVVIIEKASQPTITPGALGTTAYTGVLQKGPVGKVFRTATRTDFEFRAGGIIDASLYPDAAFDFFKSSNGAGAVWNNRVTDGNEKQSEIGFTGRKDIRGLRATFRAGNGGVWAGRQALVIDVYTGTASGNTLPLATTIVGLQKDELKGAFVSFNSLPGKSFLVKENTTAGLLTFDSDVDFTTELPVPQTDKLVKVNLENDGLSIGIRIKEGTDNPTAEWAAEVFFIEGNIPTSIRNYDNLSSDPNAPNYFVNVINDDSDSDFIVNVTDNHTGAIVEAIRPANYAGKSELLTTTSLKVQIADVISSGAAGSLLSTTGPASQKSAR